jgi:secondary thiamine-phosphate synthase enzyme
MPPDDPAGDSLRREDIVKTHTHYLWFNTKTRHDLVNITQEVEGAVRESGVQEGLCLVSAMHITAAIWVNDNEPGLWQDMWEWLERLAPARPDYRHHHTGEDNGDAHLKRSLLHHQVVLPVTQGRLDLGPWEQVFYAEFDGQRRKRVVIKVLGE